MSCRTVKAYVEILPYPTGGASHGPSCCVCGRPLTMEVPGGEGFNRYEPTPYLRVVVYDKHWSGNGPVGPNEMQYEHAGQVCSEGCAAVYARYIGDQVAHDGFVWSLCPAHGCVKVDWDEVPQREVRV